MIKTICRAILPMTIAAGHLFLAVLGIKNPVVFTGIVGILAVIILVSWGSGLFTEEKKE